jgi:pimeloyl-ACP methyl ester carboxylesterase
MTAPLPQDQFAQVNGHRIRYWDTGQGPAVLLLHGIGCSALEWRHNVAALAQRHRVLVPDLLGFGLSDKPAGAHYSLRQLGQFALDFMAALGVARAHVAGNSLGGRLALECARIAPQAVASLLLVDPAGIARRGALLEFRLATLPGLGELFTRPSTAGTRMLWRKAFAAPGPFVTPEMVATKVALARLPGAQQAFLQTLRGFLRADGFRPESVADLQAALPTLAAPTLVLWGAQDRFVDPAHAEVLRQGLPNVEVQVWERCGHAPQIECAQRFNDTALGFWARLGAASANP